MPQVDINYAAVIVAALASFVLGWLWYSPALFGKSWMRLSDITPTTEQKKKGMTQGMLFGLIAALVMSYVLAHFVDFARATTAAGGAQAGFWSWLGFVATVTLGGVLWEGKKWGLWALNNAYQLLSLLIMGIILAVWA